MSDHLKKKTKVRNSFIVNEHESFPFGFIVKSAVWVLILFTLFSGFVTATMYFANEKFNTHYIGDKNSKLNFERDRLVAITRTVTNKDIANFLKIYDNVNDTNFDSKMTKVLEKYNATREIYIDTNNISEEDKVKVRKLSFILANSMWNYKYQSFSDQAISMYKKWGINGDFIQYQRDKFFVEDTKLVVANNYNPPESLSLTRQKIQESISKAKNNKDYEDLIRLVAQINAYLGYPDYLSWDFLTLSNDSLALKLKKYMSTKKDGLFTLDLNSYIDEMLSKDNEAEKNVASSNGTISIPIEKDRYLEEMWSVL